MISSIASIVSRPIPFPAGIPSTFSEGVSDSASPAGSSDFTSPAEIDSFCHSAVEGLKSWGKGREAFLRCEDRIPVLSETDVRLR